MIKRIHNTNGYIWHLAFVGMGNMLKDLKSGKLKGSKSLKIACGLTKFPEEILSLADSLEVLDLSNNQLSELPNSFCNLKKLRIVFFANNNFTEFPKILANCPALNMIGFKANKIEVVPENAFPPKLRWLILTDNKIGALPTSIGKSTLLQKCALAGNLIKSLPSEMANCVNLELLRISANQLEILPKWLFQLPKLSWIAFAGNTASHHTPKSDGLPLFDWNDFELKELLGEGASGLISKANWISKNQKVAIKVFKGEVTSDGLPKDEMAVSVAVGNHKNLVPIVGAIKNHPEGKNGLVMELIPSDFYNLGKPPSLITCTRDVFDVKSTYTYNDILKIAQSIASVCNHMHSKGISHGDLYAHNILIDKNANCLLGDYGASSFYDTNSELAPLIHRVEVNAFGCLLEDILGLISKKDVSQESLKKWQALIVNCKLDKVASRLSFPQIIEELNTF